MAFVHSGAAEKVGAVICRVCGVDKPEREFHVDRSRRGMRRTICRSCRHDSGPGDGHMVRITAHAMRHVRRMARDKGVSLREAASRLIEDGAITAALNRKGSFVKSEVEPAATGVLLL